MRCQDCALITADLEKRVELLAKVGRRAERLLALSEKATAAQKRELAVALKEYHIAKAELDGVKFALEIHSRNHRVQ